MGLFRWINLGCMAVSKNPPIKDIIDRAKVGDESAFKEIVVLYKDELFRFLVHLTRDQQVASEILQETFLKVLTKIDKVHNPEQFKSWLFRTAKNMFIDMTRKTARRPSVSMDQVGELEAESMDTDKEYRVQLLQRAIAELPEKERLIIVCVDLEQRSYKEASEIIGISESALKSRLFRARKSLKEIFENLETNG